MKEIQELREFAERFRKLSLVAAEARHQVLLLEMAAKLLEQADKLEEATRPTTI
jgi:hypothetical protein